MIDFIRGFLAAVQLMEFKNITYFRITGVAASCPLGVGEHLSSLGGNFIGAF